MPYSWREGAFALVLFGCVQFVVLTLVAMLLYPGGTIADPTARRYSFFHNFFSDLGRTHTPAGEPNTASFLLFTVALALVGAGLILFFVASLRFFSDSRPARLWSRLGCLFGIASGIGFIGVAFAPADRSLWIHAGFALLAFQAFLPAVLAFALAILGTKGYARRYALVYLAFAALLAGYVVLLRAGPSLGASHGLVVQAAGQKIIVYAGIGCVLVQAWGARRLAQRRGRMLLIPEAPHPDDEEESRESQQHPGF
jgi:hypothetical membrane protein